MRTKRNLIKLLIGAEHRQATMLYGTQHNTALCQRSLTCSLWVSSPPSAVDDVSDDRSRRFVADRARAGVGCCISRGLLTAGFIKPATCPAASAESVSQGCTLPSTLTRRRSYRRTTPKTPVLQREWRHFTACWSKTSHPACAVLVLQTQTIPHLWLQSVQRRILPIMAQQMQAKAEVSWRVSAHHPATVNPRYRRGMEP